jgi:hypothetical protein
MNVAFHLSASRLARRLRSLLAATALLAFAGLLHAQEPVYTNRTTEMRAGPDDAAALLRTLPEKTAVQQLERKGAWTKVQFGDPATREIGWVRMMHLRGGAVVVESQPASSGGLFGSFGRLLGGNKSNGNLRAQNATVGIRGLSPEELTDATPNPAAVAKMKSFRVDKADAERFAREAKIARAEVPELAEAATAGGRK